MVQITFSWTDSHLFEFEVGGRIYGEPENDLFGDREDLQIGERCA